MVTDEYDVEIQKSEGLQVDAGANEMGPPGRARRKRERMQQKYQENMGTVGGFCKRSDDFFGACKVFSICIIYKILSQPLRL